MYNTGDFVVHGRDGLCEITEISSMDLIGEGNERDYYILVPVNNPKSRIYVPVGTGETTLRAPLTEKEALEIIDELPSIEALRIENEKTREKDYNSAIIKNDCVELFKLIKTTYTRNMERRAKGHTATAIDESYYKTAVKALHSELGYALGIGAEEMENFIEQRLGSARK